MKVLLFPGGGRDVVEAGVQPAGVVPVDPGEDLPAGFGTGGEHAALEAFALE